LPWKPEYNRYIEVSSQQHSLYDYQVVCPYALNFLIRGHESHWLGHRENI